MGRPCKAQPLGQEHAEIWRRPIFPVNTPGTLVALFGLSQPCPHQGTPLDAQFHPAQLGEQTYLTYLVPERKVYSPALIFTGRLIHAMSISPCSITPNTPEIRVKWYCTSFADGETEAQGRPVASPRDPWQAPTEDRQPRVQSPLTRKLSQHPPAPQKRRLDDLHSTLSDGCHPCVRVCVLEAGTWRPDPVLGCKTQAPSEAKRETPRVNATVKRRQDLEGPGGREA